MSRIAESTEDSFPFHEWTFKFGRGTATSRQEAVAHSACQLAEEVKASVIIAVITQSEPIHKILDHLKSKYIDPRAGPFADQAACGKTNH